MSTADGTGRLRPALQVLGAAVLWAVSGVVARVLFQRDVEPALLVQVRLTLGGLALLPLALRGATGMGSRSLPWVAGYAVAVTLLQLTYFEAIALLGVAVAVFLQYTAPLLVAAWEAARERRLPPRPVMLALALATGGSALLVLPGGSVRLPPVGLAWGLGAAVAMAAGTVVAAGAQRRGARPLPLLSFGMLAGSLFFAPLRAPWTALAAVPAGDWPFFLFISLFATALPFALYVAAVGRLRGSLAMLIAMLEPVLAAALAWAALGEALSAAQLCGAALILGGIGVAVAGAGRS